MNKKRRRAYKARTFKTQAQKTKESLYRDTLKKVRETNRRLKSLTRRFKLGSWASKKLLDRLTGGKIKVLKRGRVQIKPTMPNTILRAINKATTQFLQSKTSTRQGIEDIRHSTIESLRKRFSDFDADEEEISYEEAETMYNMFGDDDIDKLIEKTGASEVWAIIEMAIEMEADVDTFEELVKQNLLNYGNDLDWQARIRRIYYKYVV